jgi:hypothetical protein
MLSILHHPTCLSSIGSTAFGSTESALQLNLTLKVAFGGAR